jgi:sulfonate transport system substrate-binding protein
MRRTALLSLLLLTQAFAENPKEIRFATGTGVGGRPVTGGNTFAYLDNKGTLVDEFRKDGIKFTTNYFLGAGPAFNEAFANGLVDFIQIGDLPSTVGKAGGLDYKIIAAAWRNTPGAVVVPAGSRINSITELRGKRVAIFKGTATQLIADRILELNGLTEKDLQTINMNGVAQQAALASKDLDALFTSTSEAVRFADAGIGRTIYSTLDDPKAKSIGFDVVFVVSTKFEQKYPQIVQRVVTQIVKGAHQLAAGNRDEVYKNWSKSGTPYLAFKRDYDRQDLRKMFSPVLDEEFVRRWKVAVSDIKRFKYTRKDVNVDTWIEPKYVNQALKDLKLENYWK